MITGIILATGIYFCYKLLREEKYNYVDLPNTQLLIGFDKLKRLIIADMLICPHVLISGLPNSGKSKCVYIILKNLRKANIIIYSGFKEDYKGINYREIIGEDNLNAFLDSILNNLYKREVPLYVVLEELGTIRNKKTKDKIQELLCVARHYNIYIIGVIQIATKENCSFKDLFGVRISFKQIGEQNYRVLLGINVEEEYRNLRQKEFIMLSNNLCKGKTFLVDK